MVYLGVDLHKRYSYLVAVDEKGAVIREKQLVHCRATWIEFLRCLPQPVQVVIEATLNWYFLVDWLEPNVEKIVLANPFKVKAIAEAKIKTDKIDAHMLAPLLRADLIPECYISTHENRDYKSLLRHRISLVRIKTQIKNKIHALLARHAIDIGYLYSDIFGKASRQHLTTLPLPEYDAWVLNEQLCSLQHIEDSIKTVDVKIRGRLKSNQTATLLKTIPGIGHFLALLISAEIGDIQRFNHPKKLCCYAGLVPSVYSSGGKTHMGRLIRQSNKWLRWALIEAANAAIRHKTDFDPFYQRIKERKGANIAKIALARHMLTIIFRMLKSGQPFIKELLGHPHGELACS